MEIPSREADALFAERVLGKKVVYRKLWQTQHYAWAGEYTSISDIHWAPGGDWYEDTGIEQGGSLKVNHLSEYSKRRDLVDRMIEGIEMLCGKDSIIVLRRGDGTYTAMAEWFQDGEMKQAKNYGDGTPNGALLALGLSIADEVQNLHTGEK